MRLLKSHAVQQLSSEHYEKLKHRIKKTLKAAEQNRADVIIVREVWYVSAGSTDTARLVFIDESGAKTNMTRLYGRGFDGGRVYDCVTGLFPTSVAGYCGGWVLPATSSGQARRKVSNGG